LYFTGIFAIYKLSLGPKQKKREKLTPFILQKKPSFGGAVFGPRKGIVLLAGKVFCLLSKYRKMWGAGGEYSSIKEKTQGRTSLMRREEGSSASTAVPSTRTFAWSQENAGRSSNQRRGSERKQETVSNRKPHSLC